MRTFRNHIKGLAVAGIVAAALVLNATPAAADQKVLVNIGGSKACIILSGVIANVSDHVASVLGAVYEAMGC